MDVFTRIASRQFLSLHCHEGQPSYAYHVYFEIIGKIKLSDDNREIKTDYDAKFSMGVLLNLTALRKAYSRAARAAVENHFVDN